MSIQVLNSSASLAGKTLATLEGVQTFTGAKTFGTVIVTGTITASALTLTGDLAVGGLQTVTGTINGQTVSSAANFTGTLTVGGILTVNGAGAHVFSAGLNGSQVVRVVNTTTGIAALAGLELGNDAAAQRGSLFLYSTTYAGGAITGADSALFTSGGAGGIGLQASHAAGVLRFFTVATERLRITAAGDVGIATAKKFNFDGVVATGDTHITESSANTLDLVSGGITTSLVSGVLTVNGLGIHAFNAGGTGANSLRVRNSTAGTGNYAEFAVGNNSSAQRSIWQMLSTTFTPSGPALADGMLLEADGTNGMSIVSGNASGAIRFYSAGLTEVGRWDLTSSLQIGGTAARGTTAGTKRLDIFDGTAPVGTLANGISLYSTAGELRVMDAGGTATLLSPHDQTPNWVFLSENKRTGKYVRIEVEQLLKRLNKKFGEAAWVREAA
jgi:hypothetical protein